MRMDLDKWREELEAEIDVILKLQYDIVDIDLNAVLDSKLKRLNEIHTRVEEILDPGP